MAGLDVHGVSTLLLMVGALFLFSRHKIPLEYSCLVVLATLMLAFELFPYETDAGRLRGAQFLAGFGHEALVTILLLLILAKGVEVSGALRPLARLLARIWFFNRSLALLLTLVCAAMLSAFVNNTPIVVMLLPLLVGVANRARIAPSRVLMPVGFATIVGGMGTTIGTSTNLLVTSVAAGLGGPRLAMFDFVLPAAIAAAVAILYLWAIAPRLLPDRQPPLSRATPRLFESVIDVTDYSPLAGKTLSQAHGPIKENVRILRIQRGKSIDLVRLPSLTLRPGDRIHVRGTAEAIKEVQNVVGGGFHEDDLRRLPDQALVEVVVTRESPLFERKLSEAQLLLGSLAPIGIYRPEASSTQTLNAFSDPTLTPGDVLLMQGHRHEIRRLQDQHRLFILDRTIHVPRSAKATPALAVIVTVVLVAALGWLPIAVSALLGVLTMLLCRCLSLEEAWSAIDTRLALVIVTSLALGTSLTQTGAAEFVADRFVDMVRGLPPPVVLSAVLLLTSLLTEVVTNNAVAVIATPIAIATAQELGVPEIAFVLAVLFGANMSYMTPIGYQTNLLVFSAGGYRFSDFFRVGIPLQVLMWLALSLALPWLYL